MQKKLWKRFFVLWAVLLFAAGFSLTAEAADKKVTLVTDGGGSVEVTVYKSDGTTADFTKKLSKDGTSDMTVTVGRKISLKFLPVTADGFATLTFDVLDGDGKAIGRNSKNQYTIPDSDVTIKAVFGKRVYKVSATGFKAPAAGETPVQKEALTSGTPDKYSVGSIKWFYGDTPEEDKEFTGTGTFDAHKKWRAEITFTTAYPYAFSGNPNATEWEWKLNETNTLIDIEASKKKMAGKFYEIVLCTVVFPGAFFDANGGTGTMQPVFAVKGQEITLPENSFTAPEGKVFNGWDLGAAGSKITVNDITAVKAQWKATVHKVTFDANGGTGTMAEVTGVEYGTSYKLPANAFTAPAGKEFDKWDQGAAGASITIKGDVVLKAVWKDISAAGDPAASETKDPAASDGTPSGDQKEAPADTTGMSDASYVYFGGDAVTPQKTKTASTVNKKLLKTKSEKDVAESSFGLLRAWGKPSGNTIKLSWKKVKGAKKYVVYGNKCGKTKKYKKKKETKGTAYTRTNCKAGTYYKFIVTAVNGKKVLAVSKTIHVAANGGENGNTTKVKLDKKTLKLKTGKTYTLKVTVTNSDKPVKNHRKTAFESSDIRVATVGKNGEIKAVGKGTCYVYAYAQNGRSARVKVKVS